MLQFFKFVLATVVGLLFFFILMVVIVIGIGSAVSSDKPVAVKENSVLKLEFDTPIVERSNDDPFSDLDLPFAGVSTIGLVQVKEAIANAKLDENIKGIYLEMDILGSAGYGSIEEIRNALLDFKKSGKFVIAYGEVYTEPAYYLVSVADQIYVPPTSGGYLTAPGGIEFNGLSSQVVFFKGTLDKLDIQPEVFKVGTYKSAVETFLLEEMSEPSKRQTLAFLNSINDHVRGNISKARGISRDQLKQIADSVLIRKPEDALRYKLVTHLGYYDQVDAAIKGKLKLDAKKKISFVSLNKYLKAEKQIKQGSFDKRIAVIMATGDVQPGDGDANTIGSEKLTKEIRKARLDDKVKAIVLRLNSPGGTSTDNVWREVMLAKKTKPVIASMSDVAASAAYYIAMACDTIVAQPTTITGSIGIFGVLFNVENFLKNKLGVTVDGVKTDNFADIGLPTRPLTDFERAYIQQSVEQGYDEFVTKAAQGREMSKAEIEKIASGRVWSGTEAKQNGLVDVMGGLDDAILIAAKAAKVDKDYRVRYYPEQQTFLEQVTSDWSDEAEERAMQQQFGDLLPYVKTYQRVKKWEGIQMRMPFDITIR